MIKQGDTVRVTAPGKFHGQEVQVLVIDGRRMRGKERKFYKLDVKWDDMPRASYFGEDEIELVKQG